MSGVLEARFDGAVELVPILSQARNRWRLVYTTLYITRAFHWISRGNLAKKFLRAPSYKAIDVEPECFPSVNQTNFTELVKERNVTKLLQLGGVEGVITALKSNPENGICGDAQDIAFRHRLYGSNSHRKPTGKTSSIAKDTLLEAIKDPIVLISVLCAALSLAYGIKKHGLEGWCNGGSIFAAVFLVMAVYGSSKFWSEYELSKLSQASQNIKVDVTRNGRHQRISIFSIVVGDVVSLKVGDQVPADGLFLDGQFLQVDQSSMSGESDLVQVNDNNNPFLLCGTKVIHGYARMLVTSVGMATEWGWKMSSISRETDKRTPLQAKQKELTLLIAKVGALVAFLVLVVLLIRCFRGSIYDDDGRIEFIHGKTKMPDVFKVVLGILSTPVVIAAGAIPEGLLLAVGVALAYSTKRMLAHQALVRNLSACETMGSITVICTDKRGSLTMNQMKVTKFWLGQKYIEEGTISSIAPNVLELLHQGVSLNKTPQTIGSLSELCAEAIDAWADKEMCINFEELRMSCDILHFEPFEPEIEQSRVVIMKKADKQIHLHLKGAPEVILAMCSHFYNATGVIKVINKRARVKLQRVIQGMTTNGLHCIAYAHKELAHEDDFDGKSLQRVADDNLILLGLIGLKDLIRPGVRQALIDCQNAGVNIKMITEDRMPIAKLVASECGIIELNQDSSEEVVEGMEFQNLTPDEKMERIDKIRVLARSSAYHKHLMVQCLRQKGHVVAVTGSVAKDAVAIREADVGLSMGIQSTRMVKESSDVVILDNNFVSVVKLLALGRGIYINTQTFTQFQLVASFTSLIVDSVSASTSSEPPTINIVAAISAGQVPYATLQLLWLKLIVGTLAALALTIEQPTREVMQNPPVDYSKPFITNVMWRNMLAQAFYQITILLTIQFQGESIFNVNNKVKDTMIFNILVLFQIFTMFSARKFEKNVTREIQKKKLFWGIIGSIILVQAVMVEFLKRFAGTERLSWAQWSACIGIAAVSWIISWLAEFIPVPEKPLSSYFRWQTFNYKRM